jgi:hypothetical protein
MTLTDCWGLSPTIMGATDSRAKPGAAGVCALVAAIGGRGRKAPIAPVEHAHQYIRFEALLKRWASRGCSPRLGSERLHAGEPFLDGREEGGVACATPGQPVAAAHAAASPSPAYEEASSAVSIASSRRETSMGFATKPSNPCAA